MRVGVVEQVVVRHETIQLNLVPSREAKGFIVKVVDGEPAYKGPGPANYTCGRCGAVLCEGVRAGILAALVFQCSCGGFNKIPPPPAPTASCGS
jgi:hypothetical protein